MSLPHSGSEADRLTLLSKITQFQRSLAGEYTPTKDVRSLLNSMVAYLESKADSDGLNHVSAEDDIDDSVFGNIGDDELMSAETVAYPSLSNGIADNDDNSDQHIDKKVKLEAQPSDIDPQILQKSAMLARSILLKTWGFPKFRLKQEAAISRLIAGKSAVVVFPTGGGKSLVYQVPALAFDHWDETSGQARGGGLTLVVSPLVALMKVGEVFMSCPLAVSR